MIFVNMIGIMNSLKWFLYVFWKTLSSGNFIGINIKINNFLNPNFFLLI